MNIRRVECREKKLVDEIVRIHLSTFRGFFLTFMGKGFLTYMYRAYVNHANSDILIALEGNRILGFLAYSKDMSGLYKYMLKRYLIPFAWYSLGAFLRKPKTFFRILRAFLKPSESRRCESYIELASIGVLPEAKSTGVGSCLINTLISETDFEEYEYITLETDAIDNDMANAFYKKNGFHIEREFSTREGRKMYEYRYTHISAGFKANKSQPKSFVINK